MRLDMVAWGGLILAGCALVGTGCQPQQAKKETKEEEDVIIVRESEEFPDGTKIEKANVVGTKKIKRPDGTETEVLVIE